MFHQTTNHLKLIIDTYKFFYQIFLFTGVDDSRESRGRERGPPLFFSNTYEPTHKRTEILLATLYVG